jgi:hypothetical protein
LIGIVLKEGIKVEVSKKMEKWAAQELQYCKVSIQIWSDIVRHGNI